MVQGEPALAPGGSYTYEVTFFPAFPGDKWMVIAVPYQNVERYYSQKERIVFVKGRGVAGQATGGPQTEIVVNAGADGYETDSHAFAVDFEPSQILIGGTVYSTDGEQTSALANATVELELAGQNETVTTDADGKYTLDVQAQGTKPFTQSWAFVLRKITGVQITLKTYAKQHDMDQQDFLTDFDPNRIAVSGTVYSRAGNQRSPLPGATVELELEGGNETVTTDAQGKYTLDVPFPTGTKPFTRTGVDFELPTLVLSAGTVVELPDTLLMPCSVPIKITTTEPSGLPMEGNHVVITVQNPEAKGFVTVDQPKALLGAGGVHETTVHVTAAPQDKPLSDIPKQVIFGVEIQHKDSGRVVSAVSITRPLVALRIDKFSLLQAVEKAVLIADRRTGVRTWLDTNQPSLPATVVVKVDSLEAVTQPGVIIKPQSSYAAADKIACADSVNLLIPASYVTLGEHSVTVEVQPDGSAEKVSHQVLMVPWQEPRTIKILFVPTDTGILGNAAQGLTAQGTEMMLASFLGGFAEKVKAFMEEIYPVAHVEYAIDPKPLQTILDISYAIPGINKANQAENVRRAYNRRNSVSPADFVIAVFPWGKYKGPSGAEIEGAHYGSIVWYPLSIERAMLVANTYPLTTAHEIGHFFLGPKEEYSAK